APAPLPRRERADVVREHPVEERRAVTPGGLELSPLGAIDHADASAHGGVLRRDVAVADGHGPPLHVAQLGAEALMLGVQDEGLHHGILRSPALYRAARRRPAASGTARL